MIDLNQLALEENNTDIQREILDNIKDLKSVKEKMKFNVLSNEAIIRLSIEIHWVEEES